MTNVPFTVAHGEREREREEEKKTITVVEREENTANRPMCL